MKCLCLTLSRLCLAAWVGAALFFVLILLDLRHSDLFNEPTKANHARVLFPAYYQFELVVVGIAWVTLGIATGHPSLGRTQTVRQLACMSAGTALSIADYVWVYRPLAHMMDLPAMPAEFRSYHQASMALNCLVLLLWIATAMVALWPAVPNSSAVCALPRS